MTRRNGRPEYACFGMLLDGRAQQSGIRQRGHEATMLIVFNSWQDMVKFKLPAASKEEDAGSSWDLATDTNMPDLPDGSRFDIDTSTKSPRARSWSSS